MVFFNFIQIDRNLRKQKQWRTWSGFELFDDVPQNGRYVYMG